MHLHASHRKRMVSRRWEGQAGQVGRGAARVALAAALVALPLSGCRRETPAPAKALIYEHPNYARLSPAELLIESQRKGVMGRKQSLRDVSRVVETIAPLVAQSVEQKAILADLQALAGRRPVAELREELRRWQEADLLLESGGDPEAVSAAGAVGVAQWLADTARRAGLRVDEREYARIVARARRLRAALSELRQQPAEWQRAEQPGGPPLGRDQWIARYESELAALERKRLEADERRDPRKAIFAQTRYLVRLWRRFGSLDWALQAYHGGERGAERTLGYFLSEGGKSPVSFADLYFGTSPRKMPKTFSYFYGRADDHRYYAWRVQMAQEALALYRESPEKFRARWETLAPGYPMDRAWYPNELDAAFADVAALQAAYRSGRLLALPDAGESVVVETLAPLDPENERWYRGLRPEALGMLQRLAAIYREEGGRAPLSVCGATTTVEYAAREQTRGDAAPDGEEAPALTLHATGLCVDVRRPADLWDRKVLEYALSALGDRMRIAWLRDYPTNAYHLCPNPAFAREFVPRR